MVRNRSLTCLFCVGIRDAELWLQLGVGHFFVNAAIDGSGAPLHAYFSSAYQRNHLDTQRAVPVHF